MLLMKEIHLITLHLLSLVVYKSKNTLFFVYQEGFKVDDLHFYTYFKLS